MFEKRGRKGVFSKNFGNTGHRKPPQKGGLVASVFLVLNCFESGLGNFCK